MIEREYRIEVLKIVLLFYVIFLDINGLFFYLRLKVFRYKDECIELIWELVEVIV